MSGRIPIDETQSPVDREAKDKEFLAFVEEQIERMKKYSKLGDENQITFYDLNQALASYEQVYLTLISIYNIANIEFQRQQEEFDDWYAEKHLTIRARENPRTESSTKWASQKEIEMMVRREYKFEYQANKETLLILERKVAFLRRLLEAWQSQQFILNTLSKNIAAEVNASGLASS